MIGRPRSAVPESVSVDLGVVDILVTNRGQRIRFGGQGLDTDIGGSEMNPNLGMSIPAEAVETAEPRTLRPAKKVTYRVGNKPAKRRSHYEKMVDDITGMGPTALGEITGT